MEQDFTRRERKFLTKGERKWERFVLWLLLLVTVVTAVPYMIALVWTRHFAPDDLIYLFFYGMTIAFIADRLFFTRLFRKLMCKLPEHSLNQMRSRQDQDSQPPKAQ